MVRRSRWFSLGSRTLCCSIPASLSLSLDLLLNLIFPPTSFEVPIPRILFRSSLVLPSPHSKPHSLSFVDSVRFASNMFRTISQGLWLFPSGLSTYALFLLLFSVSSRTSCLLLLRISPFLSSFYNSIITTSCSFNFLSLCFQSFTPFSLSFSFSLFLFYSTLFFLVIIPPR